MTSEKAKKDNKKEERPARPRAKKRPSTALSIQDIAVSANCVGSRWTVSDIDHLARLISIIAMGQASHAARIIAELELSNPALNEEALREDAKQRLTVSGKTDKQRDARRWHRDGMIFEAISWIAAHQDSGGKALLKDPHISATMQGLDGLMIELDSGGKALSRVTIFEDKCSDSPRDKFRDEILPTFKTYHENKRASELVATAAALIEKSALDGTAATEAAGRVLDKNFRAYRAGLTIGDDRDTPKKRKALFKDYETLSNIKKSQRIGATFVTPADLRPWFDELAALTIAYIDSLPKGGK